MFTGWSAMGMVPYIGDVGKVGKYGRKACKVKDRFKGVENAKTQLENIEKAQSKHRKMGKGPRIQSTGKSEQALQNELNNIKSLDDILEE